MDYIKPLNPCINVADVTDKNKYSELVLKSEARKQFVNNYTNSSLSNTTNILTGNKYAEVLSHFIFENNYDLVAVSKHMKSSPAINIFSKNMFRELIESLDIPVILN